MNYVEEVKNQKKFQGNVVIKIGQYGLTTEDDEQLLTEDDEEIQQDQDLFFAIRQPDSGLSIASPYDKLVSQLTLNPTSIDIRRVTTTISSFSFKLLDKDGLVSQLVRGDAMDLIGLQVQIFLGRSGVGMAFADYFELPKTFITKVDHSDNGYVFSCSEQTDRMSRPIFDFKSALAVDILPATTTWTMRESIADFPATGFLKVDDEFVSYSGKDIPNNRFTGVIRGELLSTPAEHDANSDVVLVETVTDNPLNIILKLLVSGGGGGVYDVLQDGLQISESLIDIAGIEALRDELFFDQEFTLSLYNITSTLKFIEDQLLAPNNLRFTNSQDSKITLAILNKAQFVEDEDIIDENSITKFPKWVLDASKVTNVIEVNWDFSEGTNKFQERDTFEDADSIARYGRSSTLKFDFKGIKATLDGQNLVDEFGSIMLARLAFPTPEISINTHIDKSLQNIGDKSYLVSSNIPAADGTLEFASNLEIISRAINHTNGDVSFKLAFTSFTNIRSGFIAPSDVLIGFSSQRRVSVTFGRGEFYKLGYYMRLWDDVTQSYTADPPNKIVAEEVTTGQNVLTEDEEALLTDTGDNIIFEEPEEDDNLVTEDGDQFTTEDGDDLVVTNTDEDIEGVIQDVIIFEDAWTTPLIVGRHRIRFANYDEQVTDSQKRYCFISDSGANFLSDDKPTYRITY